MINTTLPPPEDSAGSIIVADVDGDGLLDFIVTGRGAIVVHGHDGAELWTLGEDILVSSQSENNGFPGHHGPGIQAGDIDGDSELEVVFLTHDGTLHVVNGSTGAQEWAVTPPPPASSADRWEHPVIANLRGLGDRDLLLQASTGDYRLGRDVAAFAFDDLEGGEAEPLWSTDDFFPLAHGGLRVADLDGDGRDEVLGGVIISPDGAELFRLDMTVQQRPHLDSLFVEDVLPDDPGLEVVALMEGGEEYVFVYDETGLHWQQHYNNWEPQNAAVGDFDLERPGLEIWCRSRFNDDQQPFVFSSTGELIANYRLNDIKPESWSNEGVEVIYAIHWTGGERQLTAAKERHTDNDVTVFDPLTGEFLTVIDETANRFHVVDVSGDWREELVVLNGSEIHVYHNESANLRPDQPRLWNRNDYGRSRMTWNYYSP